MKLKICVVLVLASILILSSYQYSQAAFLCVIDRNCKSVCDYCLSPGGQLDPNCIDYEYYDGDRNLCYRDCDVQCPPPQLHPACSTLLGYGFCLDQCAADCDRAVEQTCTGGNGFCTSSSCTNNPSQNDCGVCNISIHCNS